MGKKVWTRRSLWRSLEAVLSLLSLLDHFQSFLLVIELRYVRLQTVFSPARFTLLYPGVDEPVFVLMMKFGGHHVFVESYECGNFSERHFDCPAVFALASPHQRSPCNRAAPNVSGRHGFLFPFHSFQTSSVPVRWRFISSHDWFMVK